MLHDTLICLFIFIFSILLALPLGGYMNQVYKERKSGLSCIEPFENFLFRLCGINP